MLSLYNAKISNFLLFCSHAVCVKHMQPYVYMIPSLSQCVHYLFIVSVKNNIRINNQVCRNCLDDTDAHFTRTTKLCIGYKTKSQWKAPYSQQAIVCISGNCFSCFFKSSARWTHFAWWDMRCQQGKAAVESRTSCCSNGTMLLLGWSWSVNPLQLWPKAASSAHCMFPGIPLGGSNARLKHGRR